jgi:hypothetical protein
MGYNVAFISDDEIEREFWSGSHTRNTGPMWTDVLGDTLANTIKNNPNLFELSAILLDGITKMKDNPEKYQAMNPPNGWGTYDSALDYLEQIYHMCTIFRGAAGVKIYVSS